MTCFPLLAFAQCLSSKALCFILVLFSPFLGIFLQHCPVTLALLVPIISYYFMVRRRRGPVLRRFWAWLERLRQGLGSEDVNGGTPPADNEDPNASGDEGEDGGASSDDAESLESTAPVPNTPLVIAIASPFVAPLVRRRLPSLDIDEGLMEGLRKLLMGILPGPNFQGVEPEIVPSEGGTPPPISVGSGTRGRMPKVDGVGHYPPPAPVSGLPTDPAPHPLSIVPPVFGSEQLPLEFSRSGSRFFEEGVKLNPTKVFSSLRFGESYLNEEITVNPLFSIIEEVEPPERTTTLEESDPPPAFQDDPPDSHQGQGELGTIERESATTVTVTEISSDDESDPDSSPAETRDQFSGPSQGLPRNPKATQKRENATSSARVTPGSASGASTMSPRVKSEQELPGILRSRPLPPDPNELRNPVNPVHRYAQEEDDFLTPLTRQKGRSSMVSVPPPLTPESSQSSLELASSAKRKRVTWDASTDWPPSRVRKYLEGSVGSQPPSRSVQSPSGAQSALERISLNHPRAFRATTARVRPPTAYDLRTTSTPLSGVQPQNTQVPLSVSFGKPRQSPTLMENEQSSSRPPTTPGFSERDWRYTQPLVANQPLELPPTSLEMGPNRPRFASRRIDMARLRPRVNPALSVARPARDDYASSPLNPGLASHDSTLVSSPPTPSPAARNAWNHWDNEYTNSPLRSGRAGYSSTLVSQQPTPSPVARPAWGEYISSPLNPGPAGYNSTLAYPPATLSPQPPPPPPLLSLPQLSLSPLSPQIPTIYNTRPSIVLPIRENLPSGRSPPPPLRSYRPPLPPRRGSASRSRVPPPQATAGASTTATTTTQEILSLPPSVQLRPIPVRKQIPPKPSSSSAAGPSVAVEEREDEGGTEEAELSKKSKGWKHAAKKRVGNFFAKR
ncbi:hypothetical protein L873DRAFT_1789241 [Choiromyces venosus 120613-1]|uniref:Uncharacterized protein n=1 Tax=Choiromyces venosus 120613-1 TaxID=1336337 RepID=A0A3N4JP28_9PEZI|nr:hypothetical protein L873DRAFT_1789241 [Choiromyces venosus 120613-1]